MKKKKKIIVLIILLVGIIFAVTFGLYTGDENARTWIDKNVFRKDLSEEDLPYIDIDENESLEVITYDEYVATFSENTLTIYDSNAKFKTTLNLSIAIPIYKAKGKYLLIGDQGNSNLYLINGETIQWSKELEGTINNIAVNSSGSTGVVYEGTSYKSVIAMYNYSGEEIFKTFLSSTLATDVIISNDNKYLSFVEMNTAGTVIDSKVKTVAIDKVRSDPDSAIIYTYTAKQNEVIIKIAYDNKKIIVYTDEGMYVYYEGQIEEIVAFEKNVSFADINIDGHICIIEEVAENILDNQYNVRIVDIDSEKESLYQLKSAVRSINCNSKIIAACTGNEISFINSSGWLVKKFSSTQNIKSVEMGEKLIAIVFKNKIEILKI